MASTLERPSGIWQRNREIASLGVMGSLRMAQTFIAVSPRAARWLLGWRKPEPAELRELFEALGATYIKFGQFIASSPSLFPIEYVEEFQKCLDQTPPIPFRKVKRIIEADLGKPLEHVYSSVSHEALASASIAQVHAATLLSGEDVVIKVQKPGVKTTLTTDMNAVWLLTRLLELLVPNLGKGAIVGLVEEMYESMLDECDFNKEADNLIEFQRFLDKLGNAGVRVPKVYLEATNERVLTMERFYGIALTDEKTVAEAGEAAAASLFVALNTWFASLTQCGFFHADLHSGNLMLLRDGGVGFIDFGMVGRIAPDVWGATFSLFSAIPAEDNHAIAKAMLEIGATSEDIDVKDLAADVGKVFASLHSLESGDFIGHGDEPDGITRLMNELGDIAKSYGIRFPRSFTMLLKQFLYFERYLDLLAPGINMFDDDLIDMQFGTLGFE